MSTRRRARVDLASQLRALRNARGWTREQAAEACGIAPETMARFERGERKPSLPVVLRVAAAFGVSVEELAGVAPESEEKPLVVEGTRVLARLDERKLRLAARLLKFIETTDV